MTSTKKLVGFTLEKKYPGCKKQIGYFEKYTTGEFLDYPEFWKPIYVCSSWNISYVMDKKIKFLNESEDVIRCANLLRSFCKTESILQPEIRLEFNFENDECFEIIFRKSRKPN